MGGGGGNQPAPQPQAQVGRQLTPQELNLIGAQTRAFNADQARQAQIFGAARAASGRANLQNLQLLNQIGDSSQIIGRTGQAAAAEGARRRGLEESLLMAQRSVPGQLRALGNQIQGPNQLASLANLAQTRAGQNITNPGASTLAAIAQGGLYGSMGQGPQGYQLNQLGMTASELGDLASGLSVDPQIAAMRSMGEGGIIRNAQSALMNRQGTFLNNLASRAGQLGAAPDVVERTLTPQALVALRTVQGGRVPDAVQRLFSGTDTAARGSLETQFSAARQRLMESGVTGGALTRAMAGLEAQRASGVAGQIEARENEARNFSANLFNQATTAGLMQPAQRQQLALQGIGQAGQLGAAAGELQQGAGQLNINQALAQLQALQSSGGLALNEGQAIGGLLQGQGELQQGLLNAQQGLLNTSRLAATTQGDQAVQYGQLRNQNLGLAGQLATQTFQGNLAANDARRQSLLQGVDVARGLGGQLGAGADNLRFNVAPAMATQLAQLRNLGLQSQAVPIDILRGGMSGGGADLSGALSAMGAANNLQTPTAPQVSRGQGMLMGGLSGASSGAMVGTGIGGLGWGTAIGAVGGGLLGMFGGGGYF